MADRHGTISAIRDSEVKMLAGRADSPAISIYMPINRVAAKSEQDRLRLKNLLRDAQERLQQNMRRPEAEECLKPARKILQDHPFWIYHSADGLALFLAPGFFRCYRLPNRLDEKLVVGDTFDIKPLVRVLVYEGSFHLVAVSKNAVRLYLGTSAALTPLSLPEDMPQNMKEVLTRAGVEIEPSMQHHTVVEGGRVGIQHGQGRPKDVEKKLLEDYLRAVASPLEAMLRSDRLPIVLAMVERNQPMFRSIFHHPFLLEQGALGSPDEMNEKELHERAWRIVQPWYEKRLDEAVARYNEVGGSPRASDEVTEIVPAADQGRVDTIIAANDVDLWGTYDPKTQELKDIGNEPSTGSVELINLAIQRTIAHGGDAYVAVQSRLPSASPVAAIFRW